MKEQTKNTLLSDLEALREKQLEILNDLQEIQFQQYQTAVELLEKQAEETEKLITEIEQLRQIENPEVIEGANSDDNDKQ